MSTYLEEAEPLGERIGEFKRYFVPRNPAKSIDVDLSPMTLIGYMRSGKTTFWETISYHIEEYLVEKYKANIVHVKAYRIEDVFEYFEENRDIVEDGMYMNIIIDDAALFQHAKDQTKKARKREGKYTVVRHVFEDLGMKRGIVAWTFAAQRWYLIKPMFRQSPLIVWKTVENRDRQEVRAARYMMGRRWFTLLKWITYHLLYRKEISLARYGIGVPIGGKPFLIENTDPKRPPSGVVEIRPMKEEEKYKNPLEVINSVKMLKKFAIALATRFYERGLIQGLNGTKKGYSFICEMLREELGMRVNDKEALTIAKSVWTFQGPLKDMLVASS